MNIAGFVKTSFVDYPGKIASVVFTQGCNLRCGYCHNLSLLDTDYTAKGIPTEELFQWLSKRIGMIDAVVVSGGEPTLQKDLYGFIEGLKAMDLLVKLDTNGTNPDSLRRLLADNLLDFIALDLKAPLSNYERITRTKGLKLSSIIESVEIIKHSGLAYEFRTTLCPELEVEDISSIISDFEIASNYVVQSCRSTELRKAAKNKQNFRRLTLCFNRNSMLSLRGFGVSGNDQPAGIGSSYPPLHSDRPDIMSL
ncbi:anaerobic ribonucleoside-triphosphate reductase activating protein [Desulfosporosinus youngiae]|uniref:Anaerobic ribonucleoside-triphosphate reductase activating protein n=1 Tax=Desulfosporosinus youngiae DSM 17734 TaxID=768710 RepID=H5XS46_9FIRM|nr:anaerobic ribonucleoside-triphosphate reductase activating protein [Desulfosporosinus youngiae]EHQ87658.1 anaerobic ribonucleoside-triphosphate reductase activating protein [Desulfosporosinus youngiae DSM 17734]